MTIKTFQCNYNQFFEVYTYVSLSENICHIVKLEEEKIIYNDVIMRMYTPGKLLMCVQTKQTAGPMLSNLSARSSILSAKAKTGF